MEHDSIKRFQDFAANVYRRARLSRLHEGVIDALPQHPSKELSSKIQENLTQVR